MFDTPGKIVDVNIGFLEDRNGDNTFVILFKLEENNSNTCCCCKFLLSDSCVNIHELFFIRDLLLKYGVRFIKDLIGKPVIIHYEHESGSPTCLGFSCVDENGVKI